MHSIMVINPKGGAGKSTIANNLAGYYANWGVSVALADMDAQKSSLAWLQNRPHSAPVIQGVSAGRERIIVPRGSKFLIIDTPAAVTAEQLGDTIRLADTLIIPVLPSPVDIRAASQFIYQLLLKNKLNSANLNIALIANRVRNKTLAYKALTDFTDTLRIPLIASIRESANYLRANEKGLSLFDLRTKSSRMHIEDWLPLIAWLDGVKQDTSADKNKIWG